MERSRGGGRWRPPRGRHRLPREVVARSQRDRLLEAAIRVVAEKGYAALTIGDLTGAAGVSRTTFYELFDGKEDCFLAAYDNAVDALVRRVTAAYEGAAIGPSGRRRGSPSCSRRWPRSRRSPAWRWSTSAPRGRRRSAATGPPCSD